MLFGITPTSEGLAKRHKKVFECKLCRSVQETETHLYFECPVIQNIKLDLIRMLRQPHNTFVDPYKAIFLNSIEKEANTIYYLKSAIYAIYRDTFWQSRNQATHRGYRFTNTLITKIFNNKINFFHKSLQRTEAIEQFSLIFGVNNQTWGRTMSIMDKWAFLSKVKCQILNNITLLWLRVLFTIFVFIFFFYIYLFIFILLVNFFN